MHSFGYAAVDPGFVLTTVLAAPGAGADLNLECTLFEDRDSDSCALTAVSRAVICDAEHHQLLLTPLLLNHGGNLHQVDSLGRTLLSFAGTGPVADYLREHGAPPAQWVATGDEVSGSKAPDWGDIPPLIPVDSWREVVDSRLLAAMDRIGYFRPPEAASTIPSTIPGDPPLVARFSAPPLIESAVKNNDAERLKRLVRLGVIDNVPRFADVISRDGTEDTVDGLSAVALAMRADCRNEEAKAALDDNVLDRVSAPNRLPVFADYVPLTGPQDREGNTLLHLCRAPKVAEWLLDQGLPLDATNDAGQRSFEIPHLPHDVRAVLEAARLRGLVPEASAEDEAAEGKGRRRL